MGIGGWAPKPTYDKAASAKIPRENWMVAWTISKFKIFGIICSIEIKIVPFPDTWAARIYSFDHCVNAAPLATLAKTGILKIPLI